MEKVQSKNGVPIRLTHERWLHVTEEHSEMAGYYYEVLETIFEPEAVYKGKTGELIATREIEQGKYLIVVYNKKNQSNRKEDKIVASINVKEILDLTPQLLNMPFKRVWYSYDKEADVLYMNFKKPSHADDSELTDDDIIIRYEKGEVVGITILHAGSRKAAI